MSLTAWTSSIFKTPLGPIQTPGNCEVEEGRRKPSRDLKTPPIPPDPGPRPLPFHGRYLFCSVAFGALSSSGFAIGRGGVGPTCFPMGCMGLVCGWGLLTGRLWFLVEGLDQGCVRQGNHSGLRLQQGHMPHPLTLPAKPRAPSLEPVRGLVRQSPALLGTSP